MIPRSLLVPFAVALWALPTLADTLVLENGREISGCQITKETWAKIEYRKRGGHSVQSVDTADVVSVAYGSTSAEWRKAVELAAAGKMGEAAGFYLTASDAESSDHQQATALMNACEALLANRNFAEAGENLGQLLKKYPDTRHLAPALLGRGRALLNTLRFQEADTVFQQLKADAASKDLGERWSHEADFYLLWSAEAQQKPGVADGYKELRALTHHDYPGIANKCALRLGRLQLAQSRVGDAEAMFDEIIVSRLETEDAIVAGAYNGRGRCNFGRAQGLLSAGDSERAAEYFEEALLDFLRVHVHYPGIRSEQAEALYFGGQSFINLADLGSEIENARMNGLVLLKRCQDGFGDSEWGAKAAREL